MWKLNKLDDVVFLICGVSERLGICGVELDFCVIELILCLNLAFFFVCLFVVNGDF